jgi:hypothetical protein
MRPKIGLTSNVDVARAIAAVKGGDALGLSLAQR